MEQMRLPTNHKCWALFIYSCNIYMNIIEGVPTISCGVEGCESLKIVAKQISEWDSLFIHEHIR